MKDIRRAILSTTILLQEGIWAMRKISLREAKRFAALDGTINYVAHDTVRLLGIEPATDRRECIWYDEAIVIKLDSRPPFGVELSLEDIEKIGYTIYCIQSYEE